MTLRDLFDAIEDLRRENPDTDVDGMEVYVSCDYGDHSHTQQLVGIGDPRIIKPRKTAYSETGLALPHEDEEGEEHGSGDEVIVLCQ
jgi:hypothetical protein